MNNLFDLNDSTSNLPNGCALVLMKDISIEKIRQFQVELRRRGE